MGSTNPKAPRRKVTLEIRKKAPTILAVLLLAFIIRLSFSTIYEVGEILRIQNSSQVVLVSYHGGVILRVNCGLGRGNKKGYDLPDRKIFWLCNCLIQGLR
jgi:hypothetical protein